MRKFSTGGSYRCLALPCLALILALFCVTGCSDEPDDALSISTMTIYNIPAEIPVLQNVGLGGKWPNETTEYNPVFKLYLNASNSQDADKPPEAQAVVYLKGDSGLQKEGTSFELSQDKKTYTASFQLRKPIINMKGKPGYNPELDPDEDNGPWSGTARYFSLMLCPEDVSVNEMNSVYIKASSNPLNKDIASLDWSSSNILDFNKAIATRQPIAVKMDFEGKMKSLYEDVVLRDPHITRPEPGE